MTRRAIFPLLLLALLALGVFWFFTTFERVPGKQKVGMTGEAQRNPFLAAERFSERMGLRTTQLRSPVQLDRLPRESVLVLPRNRQSLDPERMHRALGWAAGGGHLIVEAEPVGVDDPMLDALEVKRTAAKPPADPSRPLHAALGGRKYELAIPSRLALEPARKPRVAAGDKLFVLAHGKGTVTVAASLDFARNARIGMHDHAAFFWALAGLGPAQEVGFYFRPQRLSLLGFLRENAMPVLIAAGALLLAWLWHIAPRFGPVAPDAPPARRRLLDHLRACGRFYWANNLRSRLVVAARDAALRRVARAQPDFGDASQAEKARRLSSLIGIAEPDATRFLGAAGQMRGADFIHVVQHAQRIHSALEKGSR